MNKMTGVIYDKCPNCGNEAESEGVHNGIGYVYPPLHCNHCGWSEHCYLWGTNNCSNKCTEYEKCKAGFPFRNEEILEDKLLGESSENQ